MTRHIIAIILVLFTADLFSQDRCSDLYIKDKKMAIKKAKYSQKGILQYELAMCYKSKNDTLFKALLKTSIETLKQSYDDPIKEIKIRRLFVIAEDYLELHDSKNAEPYFRKGFAALSSTDDLKPIYLFEFGIVLLNLKKYQDAINYFNTYKNLQPLDNSVDFYIDESKKGINSR